MRDDEDYDPDDPDGLEYWRQCEEEADILRNDIQASLTRIEIMSLEVIDLQVTNGFVDKEAVRVYDELITRVKGKQ